MQKNLELFAKSWGMELSASAHDAELALARDMAVKLAAEKGSITIDDVRECLPSLEFGQWAGSVFKSTGWVCVGYDQARHKNSHARIVRRWKYVGSNNSNSTSNLGN